MGEISYCSDVVDGVTNLSSEGLIEMAGRVDWFVLLDVRGVRDWNSGHIDRSVNIPYPLVTAQKIENLVQKNEFVVIYCDGVTCQGSIGVVEKLKSWGWKNIYWLNGGMAEWSRSGYPLIKEY